jgi:uncharacterized glyoxalase superfamily protein PhnB
VHKLGPRSGKRGFAGKTEFAYPHALGSGLPDSTSGSAQLQPVVSDINAARAELVQRGTEVSEVQMLPWGSFVFFSDPDGNRWAVQQLPPRD